ncbi:MAG: uncharacterized protein KVP18_002336 [Porospora cf. gigantea A]|uniref:uncharacterized protein n=1 Tax=Porospora cf. gigantea A TaxID=2853593 RepID=UPI00355A1C42|nr:MAG: hypothetical protein KVP18_002336 [Porospora cf. gigantea A]
MLLSELIEIPEELPVTAQIPLSEVIKEKANLSADIADWVRLEHPAAPADQNVGGWCALYAGCMNERFPSGHVADCLAALRQASGTSTGEALTALRQERTELEAEEAERLASTCDRLRGLEASFVEGIQQLDAAKDEHTKLIDQYDRLLDMVDSEDGYASVHATLTAASREKEFLRFQLRSEAEFWARVEVEGDEDITVLTSEVCRFVSELLREHLLAIQGTSFPGLHLPAAVLTTTSDRLQSVEDRLKAQLVKETHETLQEQQWLTENFNRSSFCPVVSAKLSSMRALHRFSEVRLLLDADLNALRLIASAVDLTATSSALFSQLSLCSPPAGSDWAALTLVTPVVEIVQSILSSEDIISTVAPAKFTDLICSLTEKITLPLGASCEYTEADYRPAIWDVVTPHWVSLWRNVWTFNMREPDAIFGPLAREFLDFAGHIRHVSPAHSPAFEQLLDLPSPNGVVLLDLIIADEARSLAERVPRMQTLQIESVTTARHLLHVLGHEALVKVSKAVTSLASFFLTVHDKVGALLMIDRNSAAFQLYTTSVLKPWPYLRAPLRTPWQRELQSPACLAVHANSTFLVHQQLTTLRHFSEFEKPENEFAVFSDSLARTLDFTDIMRSGAPLLPVWLADVLPEPRQLLTERLVREGLKHSIDELMNYHSDTRRLVQLAGQLRAVYEASMTAVASSEGDFHELLAFVAEFADLLLFPVDSNVASDVQELCILRKKLPARVEFEPAFDIGSLEDFRRFVHPTQRGLAKNDIKLKAVEWLMSVRNTASDPPLHVSKPVVSALIGTRARFNCEKLPPLVVLDVMRLRSL